MLKKRLLIISLSLSGLACAQLPDFPEVVQYGVHANLKTPGFYGVNNKTKRRVYKRFDDPSMKGAQCLSASDYNQSEAWVQEVMELARRRCQ